MTDDAAPDAVAPSALRTRTIPAELGRRLQEASTLERPPRTLHDFATLLSATTSGVTMDSTALCCANASPHQLVSDGRMRHTHCVVDALLLPLIEDTSGVVRSVSPGTARSIEFHVSSAGTTADPPDAVISLGVRRTGSGSFYELGCPYINAFASGEEYARWAAATPEAITMSISLVEAVELARELAGHTVRGADRRHTASTRATR